MARSREFLRRISDPGRFFQDAVPGIPVVEIAGKRRVLIEGHQGVTEYASERIRVKMSYGSLVIQGCGLTLAHMSKERLVVVGTIQQLFLC